MNFAKAVKRHEDLATAFARIGKAKMARLHLLRAGELKKAKDIKQECKAS